MRRLEKQGLLDSEWNTETGRPRKYYILSKEGSNAFATMKEEWFLLVNQLNQILAESI